MRSPTSFITLAVVILLAGCAAESSDSCRLDPEFCGGGTAGAFCDSDDDCAVGQECEHGDTVCEWP